MVGRQPRLVLLAVTLALLVVGLASASTSEEHLPLTEALIGVQSSISGILEENPSAEEQETGAALAETGAATETPAAPAQSGFLEAAADTERRHHKSARRAAKQAARKARRAVRRQARRARRHNRRLRRGARRVGRHAGRRIAKRLAKLRAKLGGHAVRKMKRRLAHKARKAQRNVKKLKAKARKAKAKASHKAHKAQDKQILAQKLQRQGEIETRRLERKIAADQALHTAEQKAMDQQDKDITHVDSGAVGNAKGMDELLTHATRLHFTVEHAKWHADRLRRKHRKYKDMVKRFRKYQHHMRNRKEEMASIKHYKGKLTVGDRRGRGRNFMTGGPMTSASPNGLNSLEKYQVKVLEREAKRSIAPNKFRQMLVKKIRSLYAKAQPKRSGILVALLQQNGVKNPKPQEALQRFVLAKNIVAQKLKIRAEQGAMALAKQKAAAAKKAAAARAAKALIKNGGKPVGAAKAKPRPADWLDRWPGKGKASNPKNWWGCIDCTPSKKKAGAKGGKNKRKNKRANKKKDAFNLFKGVKVPPIKFDQTINNMMLLQEVLKSYKVKLSQARIKAQVKPLVRKLKTAIVMSMLSQKEHEEILLAKTEHLESVIAHKTRRPVMVKHSIPYYRVPSKIPFPAYKDGTPREDPKTMDREVTVETANGFLGKGWRLSRHALDSGDDVNYSTRRDHEGFMKRYEVLPSNIVWRQFEGPGDAAQIRAEEVNNWRKKRYNEPLEDGTEPW